MLCCILDIGVISCVFLTTTFFKQKETSPTPAFMESVACFSSLQSWFCFTLYISTDWMTLSEQKLESESCFWNVD